MATLAADKSRKFGITEGPRNHIPVIASDIIYAGAAVGESSSAGTARPLAGGDVFLGFARAQADNSAGAASAIDVEVQREGDVELAITGVSSTAQLGDTVYATDDDTFTLTASGATAIGKLIKWLTSTTAKVYFQAKYQQSL